MKVIVYGATGGTGLQVVEQLLVAGHEVTVVVRQPDQFKKSHDRLRVLQGDVLNPSSLNKSMEGMEVVLSALGVNHRNPTTVYSEGTDNIMNAMRQAGTRRLVCLSASTLAIPPETPWLSRLVTRHVVMRLFKHLYEDMARMEQRVRKSELDWTIVRPPRLIDGPRTDKYRVALNEPMKNPKGLRGLSRADLAACMITQLHNSASIRGTIEITY